MHVRIAADTRSRGGVSDLASAIGWRLGSAPPAAQIAAAAVLSLGGGLAVALVSDPLLVAMLVAGAAFVAIGMIAPALFVGLLLLLRPLLDQLTGTTVGAVPSANAAGAVAVVLVGVTAILLTNTRRSTDPRVTAAMVAILAVSGLAASQAFLEFGSTIGIEPVVEIVRLLALLAVYLLAAQLFGSVRGVRTLMLIVALSAAAPAVLGLIELAKGPEPVAGYSLGRISGPFVGPVPFSAFLAVCALVLIRVPREMLGRLARYSLLAVILAALVATYSREGWLIFLIGITILYWRHSKAALVAVGAVCALLVFTVPGVEERTLPASADAGGRSADESLSWRIENWRGLLDRYEERPLTGWGLVTTRYVNPRAPLNAPDSGGRGYEAHNMAVRALVEGGPFMLAAYIALLVVLLLSTYRMTRDRDWPLRPCAEVLFAIWAGIAVIALVSDDPTEATATMYVALALTGALAAAHAGWRAGSDPDRAGLTRTA